MCCVLPFLNSTNQCPICRVPYYVAATAEDIVRVDASVDCHAAEEKDGAMERFDFIVRS